MLEERHQTARKILQDMRPQLDDLVVLLLQKETLDNSQLANILGPRPTITEESMNLSAEFGFSPEPNTRITNEQRIST
ncbi:MAG: hypothetical protein AB8I58_16200 [Anaerolineales bacterium]